MKMSRLSEPALRALRHVAEGEPVPLSQFSTLHKRDLVKATGHSPKRVTVTPKGRAMLMGFGYRAR
jgi:hypothetical protein